MLKLQTMKHKIIVLLTLLNAINRIIRIGGGDNTAKI
jgi:hypothetical protein